MENLDHQIGHYPYTAVQNLGTTPMGVSAKDVGMLWHH